jgi:hypothetical protein
VTRHHRLFVSEESGYKSGIVHSVGQSNLERAREGDMVSFGAWIRASQDSDSEPLRDFAASKPAWPADSDDLGKYAEFILQNETDQDKRSQLLSLLALEYGAWRSPARTSRQLLGENFGPILLAIFGAIVALILVVGIFSRQYSFIELIAKADQARGLITFLFSFTTIAIFILIAITTFWMKSTEVEARFNKAKDLLTLMIGIFGTILGFYYGSLANTPSASIGGELSLTNFGVPSVAVAPGDKTTIGATVTGGKLPLKYDVLFSDPTGNADLTSLDVKDQQIKDNKVAQLVTIPSGMKAPSLLNYVLVVRDAIGNQTEAAGALMVQPKPSHS